MKTVTKHFLLLSLMVFGVAGAAWAQTHHKYGAGQTVDLSQLEAGDTLAPGVTLTRNSGSDYLVLAQNRVKGNGSLFTQGNVINSSFPVYIYDYSGSLTAGTAVYTPVCENGEDGNAWVVTEIDIMFGPVIAGVMADVDPTIPMRKPDGNWNFLMPSGSRKVNVQFYNDYKLMNIPEDWTVKVYDQPVALQGHTATIYESAQVTLVPTNPRRVRIVTLEDAPSAQTVSVNGVDLLIAEGDTWQDIINRNSSKLYLYNGSSVATYDGYTLGKNGCNPVLPSEPYDPSITYNWCMG